MQNSNPLPPEQDHIANLIVRLKVAFRVLTSKKAIVIIDNQLDIFNTEAQEVFEVCSQIVGDLAVDIFEDIEQDVAIHNLVYGS